MSKFGTTKIEKPLDLFGNVSTVSRETIIELKSIYGKSALRDVESTTGSATITGAVGDDEFTLSTGTTTGSDARFDSAERGRYVPGTEGEVGIGIRLPATAYTGTAKAEWGYFDDNNGFGFGVDATGTYVFILRGGSYSKTYQSSWNQDVMDGTGESGETLDLQEGNIFQVDYAWYGYGNIEFNIVVSDATDKQEKITVHKFSPSQQTSILNPNLPIAALVDNGDTTTDYVVYVAGRQYSIFTPYRPNNRINSQYVLQKGSINTTFLPVVSFRKKTAYKSVAVKLEGIDIITDADILYQVKLNPSLTSPSYGTPTDTTAAETACEVDTSASAISGGELLYQGLIDASGAGASSSGSSSTDLLRFAIPEEQPVSVAVRRITGTGATVSCVLRWREEW